MSAVNSPPTVAPPVTSTCQSPADGGGCAAANGAVFRTIRSSSHVRVGHGTPTRRRPRAPCRKRGASPWHVCVARSWRPLLRKHRRRRYRQTADRGAERPTDDQNLPDGSTVIGGARAARHASHRGEAGRLRVVGSALSEPHAVLLPSVTKYFAAGQELTRTATCVWPGAAWWVRTFRSRGRIAC